MDKAKPFCIAKREVWEAYKRVKANRGAAGVDGQSIAEFEQDLNNNLYRIWNRMSSGSYFPPPVTSGRHTEGRWQERGRWVSRRWPTELPRWWSSDTWSRCWNQCSMRTPMGIGPGGRRMMPWRVARQRCWRYDWVLDLDIKGFFDNIDWELLMRAVRDTPTAHGCCSTSNAG